MKSTISPAIRSDEPLSAAVREADELQATVIRTDTDLVSSEWQLYRDGAGRRTLLLAISDFTGSVSTAFDPGELTRPNHLYWRLHKLWGELLHVRSRALVDRLRASTLVPEVGAVGG